mmetsp:Transcript_123917/g.264184  ORF Transcript_123917/g.264184 Transcript_123917/m.264184 type:complete len:239 (+) Transcript_123917:1355-2071(+)
MSTCRPRAVIVQETSATNLMPTSPFQSLRFPGQWPLKKAMEEGAATWARGFAVAGASSGTCPPLNEPAGAGVAAACAGARGSVELRSAAGVHKGLPPTPPAISEWPGVWVATNGLKATPSPWVLPARSPERMPPNPEGLSTPPSSSAIATVGLPTVDVFSGVAAPNFTTSGATGPAISASAGNAGTGASKAGGALSPPQIELVRAARHSIARGTTCKPCTTRSIARLPAPGDLAPKMA